MLFEKECFGRFCWMFQFLGLSNECDECFFVVTGLDLSSTCFALIVLRCLSSLVFFGSLESDKRRVSSLILKHVKGLEHIFLFCS